jgi:hypothetical protein
MREWISATKKMFKRLLEANVNLEHYWFVKQPVNKQNKHKA